MQTDTYTSAYYPFCTTSDTNTKRFEAAIEFSVWRVCLQKIRILIRLLLAITEFPIQSRILRIRVAIVRNLENYDSESIEGTRIELYIQNDGLFFVN